MQARISSEDAFLAFVGEQAKKLGKSFFLDTGEGRDCDDEDSGMYLEDLSGWLIDFADEQKAKAVFKENRMGAYFDENYVLAVWKKDKDGISITFNQI